MVDAEEHRAVGRDVLRVPNVDGLEAEPEPEPNDEPYGGIETVRGLGCRARRSRLGAVRATSARRRMPTSRWCSARQDHPAFVHDRLLASLDGRAGGQPSGEPRTTSILHLDYRSRSRVLILSF